MADDEPKTTQQTDCSPDRPGQSEYTEEIGDMICGHLVEGRESLCYLFAARNAKSGHSP
jgi:hypothetical protein